MALGICCCGMFYDSFAAIVGCGFGIVLFIRIKQQQKYVVPNQLMLVTLALLPVIALLTVIYAVDSGMAFMGFAKYLPVTIFILVITIEGSDFRDNALEILPYIVTVITTITLVLYFTPVKKLIYINGRYSGSFQYANAYAMLLLICLIILVWGRYKKISSVIMGSVLIGGIVATGSRAVLSLMVASMLVSLVMKRKNFTNGARKLAISVLCVVGVGIGIAIAIGATKELDRYTHISLTSSTLMSRLLYNIDGLRIAFTHPFGLGYKGYSFYQGAVQTGNYTVIDAHNELLQTALDFGLIVALAVALGFVLTLIAKKIPTRNRLILIVLAIHCLFDWDMQFTVMIFILCLLVGPYKVKEIEQTKGKRVVAICTFAVAMAICLWLSAASMAELLGSYSTASAIYSGLTTSQMRLINGYGERERYEAARSICSRNDYCTIALEAMAELSARNGDFMPMSDYAQKAMESKRYNSKAYEFYIYVNGYAMEHSLEDGDNNGAYAFARRLVSVLTQIEKVNSETSRFAKYLYHKPVINIDEHYIQYIANVSELIKEE